jgi:cytochrome c553
MRQIKNQAGASRILVVVGLALLVILALIGLSYGPDLVGYYRFNQAVATASEESTAKSGAWPQLSDTCIVCHGYNGNPVTQIYPRLAGQPAAYVARQLTAFANGQRVSPTMSPLALSLTAADVGRLATFFAAQTVAPNAAFSPDPARQEKGELLVKTANCAACHGAGLRGHDEFPRLVGQGHDYLVRQLSNFRNGTRKDASGAMPAIAAGLSDDDIENTAQFLASHRGETHEQ